MRIMKLGWKELGWVLVVVACTPKTQEVGNVETGDDDGESGDDGSSSDDGEPGTATAACESTEAEVSYSVFASQMAEMNDLYFYTRIEKVCVLPEDDGFSCNGYCDYEIGFEVQSDAVTRRRLALLDAPDEVTCPYELFDEIGDDIGSHEVPFDVPVRTVEQLYATCCEDVLGQAADPDSAPHFTIHDDGILKSCWLESEECAESCVVDPPGELSITIFGVGPLP
jgi:hypothetical protein